MIIIGAKGKYAEWLEEDNLLRVKGWARDGFSDVQIAKKIGVNISTLYDWTNRFPVFLDAIKEGRKPVETEIEDAFYSICQWNEVEETTEETIVYPSGKVEKHTKVQRKRIPPQTAALIFALKNLNPNRWKQNPVPNGDGGADVFADFMELVKKAKE